MPEQSDARFAPIAPDPTVMDRIRSEEIYREQVRQSLQPSPTVRSRLMGFLNSSFGIFCLSSNYSRRVHDDLHKIYGRTSGQIRQRRTCSKIRRRDFL